MFKKLAFAVVLLALLALPFAGTALAKSEKFTFTGVDVGYSEPVTIYATLKTVNKGDLTHCDYFTTDNSQYLGYYQAPTTEIVTEQDVMNFCVDNFTNRIQ